MKQECRLQMDSGQERLTFLLIQAKKGDSNARETLIKEYSPFIMRVAAVTSKRYLDPTSDDEYSVALIAFNEAIDNFSPAKRCSFLAFANIVIRRRLIDYFRKQRHKEKEIPLSGFQSPEDYEEEEPKVIVIGSQIVYQKEMEIYDRRAEIEELKRILAQFGITLNQLVESSPKHRDTRENLFYIAEEIINYPPALAMIMKDGSLLYSWMTKKFGLSRKTLRRHRLFLVALCLLKTGDFPYLSDYIKVQ